jgi:hypothetical protein
MKRRLFRTISPNNRREWEKIIRAASSGKEQVLCFTGHSYDNLRRDIDLFLPDFLRLSDSLGLDVIFATATQAGAALSKSKIGDRPDLEIIREKDEIIIRTSSPIFQKKPYCVLVDSAGIYRRINPAASGPREWRYHSGNLKIVCAVCDNSGQISISSTD